MADAPNLPARTTAPAPPPPMNGLDLLSLCKPAERVLANPTRIKLVRHASPGFDLEHLHRLGHLEEYQRIQGREVFKDHDFLLSFLAEPKNTHCRFIGVYAVGACHHEPSDWTTEFPFPEMPRGDVLYDLHKVAGFEPLENRLVVDWGAGTRSWVQNYRPKRLIEVYPEGHARDFPGYQDVLISFEELDRIISHPEANRLWHTMLSAVAGVYLITDLESGQLYVGSASGQEGLLGRWKHYVAHRHGHNKNLRELLEREPDRHHHFTFSILRTLPKSLTKKEVVEVESLFKRKLGSRAFGLNAN